jgi:hypothetical protein
MAMDNRLLVPRYKYDPDAARYLAAVEAADGQALETPVRVAIDTFIKGLKATPGLFDAIKASCILCGARTITGALVPLAGAAPTAQGGWASGDYSRTDGMTGDANALYLDTNFPGNSLASDSVFAFVNGSGFQTDDSGFKCPIGVLAEGGPAGLFDIAEYNSGGRFGRVGSLSLAAGSASGILSDCSIAVSATSNTSLSLYQNGIELDSNSGARLPIFSSDNLYVFTRNQLGGINGTTDATINIYIIGDGLPSGSVSALHTAVDNLITAIGEAL